MQGGPDKPSTRTTKPRLSLPGLKVLRTLLDSPTELAGSDIHRATMVNPGTLYPLLIRLETAGWLHRRWEDVDPKVVHRPRRRLLRLTPMGKKEAEQALAELSLKETQ